MSLTLIPYFPGRIPLRIYIPLSADLTMHSPPFAKSPRATSTSLASAISLPRIAPSPGAGWPQVLSVPKATWPRSGTARSSARVAVVANPFSMSEALKVEGPALAIGVDGIFGSDDHDQYEHAQQPIHRPWPRLGRPKKRM